MGDIILMGKQQVPPDINNILAPLLVCSSHSRVTSCRACAGDVTVVGTMCVLCVFTSRVSFTGVFVVVMSSPPFPSNFSLMQLQFHCDDVFI